MRKYTDHLILLGSKIKDALLQLNELNLDNILFVVDKNNKLVGSLTDGDIRRGLINGIGIDSLVDQIIQLKPKYIVKGDNNIEKINPSISTINNCNLDILPTEVENNTNISTNIPVDIFNDHLLINNLSILSHIEKYQKLSVIYDNTNNKLNFQIQIDDSYFPQLSRWYYNQNRTNTISIVDNLIDYSLQQYAYYTDTNNEKYIKKYNSLLNNAQKGLLNLKITYESDIENSFKIGKIIEKITNL